MSLITIMIWPHSSHPKRNDLPIASPILEESASFPDIDFEESAKNDVISFCLNNIKNEKALLRGLHFYETHWGNSHSLKAAIKQSLLASPDIDNLIFWLSVLDSDEQAVFLQDLQLITYELWAIKRRLHQALPLTLFIANYCPNESQQIVQRVWNEAQKGDDIPLLLTLMPLMKEWRLQQRNVLASNNLVADATFLYQKERFEEAHQRLQLALFMNEHNNQAHMLVHLLEQLFSYEIDNQSLKLVSAP